MFAFAPRSFGLSVVALCLLTTSALAQEISAKDAWQDLRARAREGGVLIASQGATDYGNALVATDVRIISRDGAEAGMISIPELRVETRGGERVTLIPSSDFTITVRPGRGMQRDFAVHHDGEITYLITDNTIDLDLAFGNFDVTMTGATRRGEPVDQGFELSLDGVSATMNALREGALEVILSASQTQYAFHMTEERSRRTMRQAGEADIEDLRLELTGSELDMLSDDDNMLSAAFDAGFALRLALTSGRSVGRSEQDLGGMQIAVNSVAGASDLLVDISDGALLLETNARDGEIGGGTGPMQGQVGFERLALSLGLPLIATTEDQPVHYSLELNGLAPSAETLGLVGAQDFAGETVSLALGLSANAHLTQDFGPDFDEPDEPPFDVSQVRLDRLDLSVGDARLSGNGAFTFLGGLLASIDADAPNGNGDFVFDLIGGDALLTRLSALGLVPQDQQFFARMMMNGLGRPVGEDHLRSEVTIRPGGAITVNGAPLPF